MLLLPLQCGIPATLRVDLALTPLKAHPVPSSTPTRAAGVKVAGTVM
jgi:hypothetical protein